MFYSFKSYDFVDLLVSKYRGKNLMKKNILTCSMRDFCENRLKIQITALLIDLHVTSVIYIVIRTRGQRQINGAGEGILNPRPKRWQRFPLHCSIIFHTLDF